VSKALANALTLAVVEQLGLDIQTARAFANDFVEENADLFGAPDKVSHVQALGQVIGHVVTPQGNVGDQTWLARPGTNEVAPKHLVRVVGDDGLTDKQRIGAATVGLCPNCQQPTNDHLPGCARIPETGSDSRAVTKQPLPPSS